MITKSREPMKVADNRTTIKDSNKNQTANNIHDQNSNKSYNKI